MILIKIKRDSIKKNPNAGRDNITVYGPREVSFKCEGPLPTYLKEGINCFITQQSIGKSEWYEGVLIEKDNDIIDSLLKEKESNITVNVTRFVDTSYRPAEPAYLFEYEDPLLKCCNCNQEVAASEIRKDCNYDGCWDECPKCEGMNTFEDIEYEHIDDAIINSKLNEP